VYKLSGTCYERPEEHRLEVAYAFRVGGDFAGDFLRVLANRVRLMFGNNEWKYQWALREYTSMAREDHGIDPGSQALMFLLVSLIKGDPWPREVSFYRDVPRHYALGKVAGPAEALVKFGDYSVLIVVDGVAYAAFAASPAGFNQVFTAEEFLKSWYHIYMRDVEMGERSYSYYSKELEDARRLAEEFNLTL